MSGAFSGIIEESKINSEFISVERRYLNEKNRKFTVRNRQDGS